MDIHQLFETGEVLSKEEPELITGLLELCNGRVSNEEVRHRELLRGITINHILMQRHIDKLNKQNNTTQRWVIVLAAASLIGTAVQIGIALYQPNTTELLQQTQPKPHLSFPVMYNHSSCKIKPRISKR